MTTAGWAAPHRPEVYRPRGDASADDRGAVGRALERMRPDEGWASLPLVLLLVGTTAWSISDARWILGQDNLTSFLIWVAIAAALWGYVSARLDLSPWLAHTIGCVIGAFILIEVIGATLPNSDPGLVGWFNTTATSVTQAYLDLTWRHQVQTLQFGHFCLILGIVVWGTAQAASYDVFGYHRSVNGVLLLAVVLIANMALTLNDQFVALVVFSAAALVLLLLAHAADERTSWLRHRIWRGRDFQAPHLRGGLAFASIAVAGSLVLTMVASSAPLASSFKSVSSDAQNAFGWLSGLLPNGGASRVQPTADFGPSSAVLSKFQESNHDVFTIKVQSATLSYHWRMATYDTFETVGWTIGSDSHQDQVDPGASLDAGTLDLIGSNAPGRRPISVVIHIQDTSIQHLIVANEPYGTTASVQRMLVGTGPSSANVAWLSTSATDYTVSAYAPDIDTSGSALTEWLLEHAGTNFPAGLLARYTQGTAQVKSDGQQLLRNIATEAHASGNSMSNEFDVANAIQGYLQSSSHFTYNADISSLMPRCAGLSTVDCFAFLGQGFCEQYATTMTMLMRMAGYPARYVLGYLPGSTDPQTLVQQVTSQQKHAWVEVYFPTYGWIPFDPTGGGVGRATLLPAGSAVTMTPTPPGTAYPSSAIATPTPAQSGGAASAGNTDQGSGNLAYLLLPLVLVLVVLFALFVFWWRRPRRLEGPDTVYRNVVRLASRLGYKPAPTQTMYEYAGMLADIVPQARDSLGIVAMAAVDVTYGKREISSERLAFLALAQKLIRRSLLRMAVTMPRMRVRTRRPHGPADRRGKAGGGRP